MSLEATNDPRALPKPKHMEGAARARGLLAGKGHDTADAPVIDDHELGREPDPNESDVIGCNVVVLPSGDAEPERWMFSVLRGAILPSRLISPALDVFQEGKGPAEEKSQTRRDGR